MMHIHNKPNFKRERIQNENLLEYIDLVTFSDRNKEIVVRYVNGENYPVIAKDYGLSATRIANVVSTYILKAVSYRNNKA